MESGDIRSSIGSRLILPTIHLFQLEHAEESLRGGVAWCSYLTPSHYHITRCDPTFFSLRCWDFWILRIGTSASPLVWEA